MALDYLIAQSVFIEHNLAFSDSPGSVCAYTLLHSCRLARSRSASPVRYVEGVSVLQPMCLLLLCWLP